MEKFIAHGYYTVSNAGGYEIMISNDGESARIKDDDEITDWLPIEFMTLFDGSCDAIIDPEGYKIPLSEVMRVY